MLLVRFKPAVPRRWILALVCLEQSIMGVMLYCLVSNGLEERHWNRAVLSETINKILGNHNILYMAEPVLSN
jgi:hypothetical protein